MPREYLKKATKSARTDAADVSQTVSAMLSDIEQGGEDAARRYATQLDGYDGPIVLSADAIAEACARVPQGLRDDITFARDNVRSFAEMQKQSVQDTHTEVVPGLIAGQKAIPCNAAGCYIPGGRYSHVASAIMTVTTATSQPALRHAPMLACRLQSSLPPICAGPTVFWRWVAFRGSPR